MEGRSLGLRKGTWTAEEDSLLRKCIEKYGEGKWHQVPSRAGLNRCRKSCRLRWLNYLKPSIKRGRFSHDEIDLVIRLHKLLGNRWSLIAGRLPGRTANDIKNYWNTHISKLQDHYVPKNMNPSLKENVIETPTDQSIRRIEVIKPRPRSFSNGIRGPLLNPPPENPLPVINNGSSSSSGKDGFEAVRTVEDETKERMWWESLLEEAEEDEKLTANATSFDVDLWNLLNE